MKAHTPLSRLRSRALQAVVDRLMPSSLLVRRGPRARRRVALSFDDGPDAHTIEYLDVLDRLGVLATFFVVGDACAARRKELLEMVRRGHEVAGHGYDHEPFPRLDRGELLAQLSHTAALLPPQRSGRPLVRPPRGATSLRSLAWCAAAGYTTVLWSLDSDDCRCFSADEVAARVTANRVSPGEIVLLHEGQRWTLEALPRIVDQLRTAGYELVTVGELLTE